MFVLEKEFGGDSFSVRRIVQFVFVNKQRRLGGFFS